MFEHVLRQAARELERADALLIGAGAGMGVDSGLPDFRGDEGFWKAYPPLKKLGVNFVSMANPDWFHRDPELAWGFYGHRHALYRATEPHRGYDILRRIGDRLPGGAFAFTSNVDGHFHKAGFEADRVLEVHGSLQHVQCLAGCVTRIWELKTEVTVDPDTFRAAPPLPACPACGGLARPNVLMFGDWEWLDGRAREQARHYQDWLEGLGDKRVVAVELGAGAAIPTVRLECERRGRPLIRINVREPQVPPGGLSIPLRALQTLERLETLLKPKVDS